MRWNGAFCFFWYLDVAGVAGEGDRLRFVVGGLAESEDELVEEIEKLVLDVEGFWVEVAWRVSLESLGGLLGLLEVLRDDDDFIVGFFDFGGLEKSTSEESLSEELLPEDDESVGAALALSLADSLSDDKASEEDSDAAFFISRTASPGSSLDEDVSEEDDVADDLGGAVSATIFAEALPFAFCIFLKEASDSDSDSELEVSLESAFRFVFETRPSPMVFFERADLGNFASTGSSSSSASLSELELEVDDDDTLAVASFASFLVFFGTTNASFISTSESLASLLVSLSPLLLVSSFAVFEAVPTSRAAMAALPGSFPFFDSLASLVPELSSESLLLVSSICVFFA